MRGRVAFLVAASGLLVLTTASPAAAEAKGRIVGIKAQEGAVQIAFTVAGLAADAAIDPASIQVTLAGASVQAEVAAATDETRAARFVMLAIDTSGSMAGDGIVGAREAASRYLDEVPADVQVGLVTFADAAELRVPVSKDRSPVRAVVNTLQARGDTALYDAIVLASANLPAEGDRQVLLLSDGADDGSRTTLPAVTALLAKGEVGLNAVAFQNTKVQSTLNEMAKAAGGRVVSTEQTEQLSAAFAKAAASLDTQVVLTAPLPEGFEGAEATVTVAAVADGQPVTDTALVAGLFRAPAAVLPQDYGPRPVTLSDGPLNSPTGLYLALAAVFLAVVVIMSFALSAVGGGRGDGSVSGRLSIYTLSRPQPAAPGPGEGGDRPGSFTRSAVGLADRVVKSRGLEAGLDRRLQAGGIPLKPAEWLMVHVGTVLCLPLFVLLITNANLVLVLAALILAVLAPLLYLSFKQGRRKKSFLAQLPDVLQLMSGSLSSGYSLPQSVDAVVRQGNQPVAEEFNKALVEARLGAPIEDSLEDVATRMQSIDFHWVVMAVRIQRDVGGNLSEILSTVSATLRERERLRRQVQVLSAEGRLSAWILGGLPPVFALYLLAAQPEYLTPLFTEALGLLMVGVMVVLMAVGTLWLRKVVRVEV